MIHVKTVIIWKVGLHNFPESLTKKPMSPKLSQPIGHTGQISKKSLGLRALTVRIIKNISHEGNFALVAYCAFLSLYMVHVKLNNYLQKKLT